MFSRTIRTATASLTLLAASLPLTAHAWLLPPDASETEWNPAAFTTGSPPPVEPGGPPLRVVLVGDPPPGVDLDEVEDALRRASAAWSDVGCADVSLTYEGVVSEDEIEEGDVPVSFVDPAEFTVCFPAGVTRLAAAPCPIAGGSGVALNATDFTWSAAADQESLLLEGTTRYAIDAVATHELGHVLGLGHSDANPEDVEADPSLRLATMAGRYLVDGGQLTLAADDRRGLCTLYPSGDRANECEADAECVTRLDDPLATCATASSPSVCEEERGEVGSYCSSGLLTCPGLCLETSDARTGYCTVECVDDSGCPDDFACDEVSLGDDATTRVCIQRGPSAELPGCATVPVAPAPSPLIASVMALFALIRRRRTP